MPDFYALLIGIDYYYPRTKNYNNLKGCVRDIDKVADYLERSLKITPEKITRLTSPLPNTNSSADVRMARQEQAPTYQNIVNAFNQIAETAQAQDLVYIHYSGHGARMKTIFPELKGEGQFDEGLVPMDVGDTGHYLRDVEMTTLLKRLTDKGLIVTMIFDSCHSGGATRGDGEIRGSRDGEPDMNDRPYDSAVATREDLIQNWRLSIEHYQKEGWLPNQRNYVFLGACRPTEYAYEVAFETGNDRNGVLTYWMFDTLNAVPTGLTYQALYDRVKGQIQSKFPNQLPMLLGESDRLVFGSEIKPVQYSLTVNQVNSEEVTLDGGLAQGLSRGARFALYPVGSDFSDITQRFAVVEITELEAITATAKILTAEESGIAPVIDKLEPGLPAVMESAPLDLKHLVRLYQKAVGNREYELPPELAAKQDPALEQVRRAMQGNGWVTEVQGNEEEGHYQVAVDRQGKYEISRLTPIENLTPPLSIDDPDAPTEVVKRLVHLAKYQTAQALDNPTSEFKKAIEYELLDADKQPFPDPNHISLKSGDRAYVRLKNISSQLLTVAILDFEATWKISQIPIQGHRGAFYSLHPEEEIFTRLRFEVPNREYYQQSKETLKLFVTCGNANFQWLILPPLDSQQVPEEDKRRYYALRGSLHAAHRNAGTPHHLTKRLSKIGADTNNPPTLNRASYDPDPNADWLTQSILLTVRL